MTKEVKQEQEVPAVSVPLAMLADVVNLIDMVSERGAFKGAELAGIGRLREAFAQPINEYNAKQAEPKVDAEDPQEDDVKEEDKVDE